MLATPTKSERLLLAAYGGTKLTKRTAPAVAAPATAKPAASPRGPFHARAATRLQATQRGHSAPAAAAPTAAAPTAAAPAAAADGEEEEHAALVLQRRWRSRSKQLELQLRLSLKQLTVPAVCAACNGGLDGIAELISEHLGANVWQRAVVNAPDAMEEEEMLEAMCDLLRSPARSRHAWMLATPTKSERLLLAAYGGMATKSGVQRPARTAAVAVGTATPVAKHAAATPATNSASGAHAASSPCGARAAAPAASTSRASEPSTLPPLAPPALGRPPLAPPPFAPLAPDLLSSTSREFESTRASRAGAAPFASASGGGVAGAPEALALASCQERAIASSARKPPNVEAAAVADELTAKLLARRAKMAEREEAAAKAAAEEAAAVEEAAAAAAQKAALQRAVEAERAAARQQQQQRAPLGNAGSGSGSARSAMYMTGDDDGRPRKVPVLRNGKWVMEERLPAASSHGAGGGAGGGASGGRGGGAATGGSHVSGSSSAGGWVGVGGNSGQGGRSRAGLARRDFELSFAAGASLGLALRELSEEELRAEARPPDGFKVVVSAVATGSAAAAKQLPKGVALLAINGQSLESKGRRDALRMLGAAGTVQRTLSFCQFASVQ